VETLSPLFFWRNEMVEINVTDSTGKQPRKVGFFANQPENNNLAEINAFKLVIGKIPETTYFCQKMQIYQEFQYKEIRHNKIPILIQFLYPGGQVNT
jgi:hypothetical protein